MRSFSYWSGVVVAILVAVLIVGLLPLVLFGALLNSMLAFYIAWALLVAAVFKYIKYLFFSGFAAQPMADNSESILWYFAVGLLAGVRMYAHAYEQTDY